MPIEYKTRTQLVAEAIRQKILVGDIKAGEPIRQAALATELDVSRIPVREALLLLEGEGLVNFEAHKGATAAELSISEIDEIFDLRATLEVELLKQSLPNMTDDHFNAAKQSLETLEDKLKDADSQLEVAVLNKDFHFSLYAAANRPLTYEFVENLNRNAERYVRMHIVLAGGVDIAPDEHRNLFELCRKQSVNEACEYLKHHILSAKEGIKDLLGS